MLSNNVYSSFVHQQYFYKGINECMPVVCVEDRFSIAFTPSITISWYLWPCGISSL